MSTIIRTIFLRLLARAPKSRLAAYATAFFALVFARQLLRPVAASAPGPRHGRVIEGEFRRIAER